MVTVIVTHEVKNFADWKIVFEAGEAFRQQNGVKTLGVFNAVSNPNMVTIMTEVPSEEVVNGMMSSPKMKEDMENAGVIGAPEAKILNRI